MTSGGQDGAAQQTRNVESNVQNTMKVRTIHSFVSCMSLQASMDTISNKDWHFSSLLFFTILLYQLCSGSWRWHWCNWTIENGCMHKMVMMWCGKLIDPGTGRSVSDTRIDDDADSSSTSLSSSMGAFSPVLESPLFVIRRKWYANW